QYVGIKCPSCCCRAGHKAFLGGERRSAFSQTWTLFKETAPRFKHPFGTSIASTYYCYTEPQTNQPMYQRKGT
ncbi:MAG: hypothetical protein ACKPKO_62740, partial [Candidatus Fonsibacter sp.]